jgi:response regulator RpfG family c-di-GMP phosphodiesterase
VDDEPLVLQGLRRTLRPHFDVSIATGGLEALGCLREDAPFALLLSDMRMPIMDGAQLLARARELAPDTVRILLTGHADLDSALAAVNHGQIFRFLTKPCPPEELLAALQAGAEQFRLVHAERELLEQTLTGAVKALAEVLALSNPTAFGRSARVHRTVAALCARLAPADRWAIEVAAQLSQIGCIQLPAAVAEKLYFGQPLSATEQGLVERGPTLADQLLANIPRLEPVRAILAAQATPTGGGRARPEPPLGARLLRLALDLDTLEAGGLSSPEALAVLQARLGTYDAQALKALEADVSTRTATEVQELALSQVRSGMQLAEDLRSRTGVLLVARGFVVSQGLLMKLQTLEAGVREPIKVVVAAGLGASVAGG